MPAMLPLWKALRYDAAHILVEAAGSRLESRFRFRSDQSFQASFNSLQEIAAL
jgi:hypothetical protein